MKSLTLMVCVWLCLGIAPRAARAALGGRDETIEKDRSDFQGVRASPQIHASYVVHQITSDGMVLREYTARASGKVFGVSWKGASHPDLSGVLGPYADDLKKIIQAKGKRLYRSSHQIFQNENLVVEKSGHLGSMRGRAYVPALVPPNTDINEIQ